MTVRILFGGVAKWADAGTTLPNIASSEAGAKAMVKAVVPGFLSNSPLDRFKPNLKPSDLDDPVNDDFVTMTVEVVDRGDAMGSTVFVTDVESIIDKWATYANVPQARGDRIAFVSNVDRIYKKGEPTRFIWQVTLSTFVIYSYQRAVPHFPRTQDEANADMQDLYTKISALSDTIELNIHTY